MKKQNLLFRVLTWFFIAYMAAPLNIVVGQVLLEQPIMMPNNTIRLVVDGPTTDVRYDVYGTNTLSSSISSWPLLVTGKPNQVIFDFANPFTNAGFFIVTSNYVTTTNPGSSLKTAGL